MPVFNILAGKASYVTSMVPVTSILISIVFLGVQSVGILSS